MEKVKKILRSMQLPSGDEEGLRATSKRFKDGGQYRIEIPSCEGPVVFREVLAAAKRFAVPIHRVSQGSGIMMLLDSEIKEFAAMGRSEGIEVCLFVGPRAIWETGAQAVSSAGKVIGWQHRGADQLGYAIDDVMRASDLGIRSILAADIGLVWILNRMKREGQLPPNFKIKSSVTLAVANPATARIFEECGVTSLNVATDLSPAQVGGIRAAVDIPIDMYVEVPDGYGGYIRFYEMPELLRVAAPIYFKFGLRNAPDVYPTGAHLESVAATLGSERVRRARLALDLLKNHVPEAAMSPLRSTDLGIPEE